jgi:hypothetical protein
MWFKVICCCEFIQNILMLLYVKYIYVNIKYTNIILHTYRQIYIIKTQQNIQFHGLYFQTGFGIGCYHLIPTTKFMRIQTTELETEVISFPSWIWNFLSNSIPC